MPLVSFSKWTDPKLHNPLTNVRKSIPAERQHTFLVKSHVLNIEENFLIQVKGISKARAGGTLEDRGAKPGCLLSLLLIISVLEITARAPTEGNAHR